jgi:predicted HicB family RNase H-like nuclease
MTRKQIKEQAARYIKYIEWSDEDHCFIGRCPEVFVGAIHGTDEARVYAELCETVEEWIELLQADSLEVPEPLTGKKEFSGKFVLRVDPGLHKRLVAKALTSGDSLNAFCKKVLAKA